MKSLYSPSATGRSIRHLIVAAIVCLWAAPAGAEQPSLLLATTTSVRDSGLLDALLPDFEKRSGIRVRVVAVGSGAALRMGAEGNADLLLGASARGETVRARPAPERPPAVRPVWGVAARGRSVREPAALQGRSVREPAALQERSVREPAALQGRSVWGPAPVRPAQVRPAQARPAQA